VSAAAEGIAAILERTMLFAGLVPADLEALAAIARVRSYGRRRLIAWCWRSTKTQLAGLLGTIPETLSRLLARLSRDGLIALDGPAIIIHDCPAL
jgi:CRP-like cAMP-binding protein